MTKRYFMTVALVVATFFAVSAQTVDLQQARQVASALFASSSSLQKAPAQQDLRLVYTSQKEDCTCFYVFNNGTDGGFAIIGGDAAASQVLGFCDHGTFNLAQLPAPVKWLLNCYTRKIAASAQQGIPARKVVAARHNVNKILTTEWSQEEPFNNAIPVPNNDESNCLATGCVATATAQVMKHFNYPTHGVGSHSYTCSEVELADGSKTTMSFSANFGATTYDWANMRDKYFSADNEIVGTTAEHEAIATLMYHVGVASDMTYGAVEATGSGTQTDQMADGLRTYFDYDCVYDAISDECTEGEWDAWEEKVYQELAAGYPIVYAGEDPDAESGHCFVIDGYNASNNTFHVNWGWAGTCDGFYVLWDGLAPSETGTGGGSGSYSSGQEMIYLIRPRNSMSALENTRSSFDGVWYNLQGIPVADPSNGIFIYNGKKVVR